MKKLLKKIIVTTICMALAATMLSSSIVANAVTTKKGYYSTYSDIATIKTKSSCGVMQGLAVGSTYMYAIKKDSADTKAFITKTNRKTKSTTVLKDSSSGSEYFNYLGHANDMCCTSIDNYTNLYITTMKNSANSIIRMRVNGSKITKMGAYTLLLNNQITSVSGICVYKKTSSKITFLCKKGCDFYFATLGTSSKSGTMVLQPAFNIDVKNVAVNGKSLDLSTYIHQGFGYYKNNLFVPLTGSTNKECSIIAVYDISKPTGVITSSRNLSFRITSKTYSGLFEIESCGICSSDGKLYFNTNRRKADGSANYDGIHAFKKFVY